VAIVHRDGSIRSTSPETERREVEQPGAVLLQRDGSVTITAANGSTVSTCADAVRFVNVGGGVNQPPTAVNDTAVTTMNSPVAVNVISNDTDDGGIDAASIAIVTSPVSGRGSQGRRHGDVYAQC